MPDHVATVRTQGEYLADLRRLFGEPDDDQLLGLEDAARLLAGGKVSWSQVNHAIDGGWEPRDETVFDYLYGADDSVDKTGW